MIHLITGGSGSGKSAYAEEWLVSHRQSEKLLYIATMRPYGAETLKKIQRHQRLRAGKGFETWECYGRLADEETSSQSRKYAGVLLECMSNHLANLLYTSEGKLRDMEQVRKEILDGISYLEMLSDRIAIVTNEIHSDIQKYSEETRTYIQLLGEINQALGERAEKVTEVVYGIPVIIKG